MYKIRNVEQVENFINDNIAKGYRIRGINGLVHKPRTFNPSKQMEGIVGWECIETGKKVFLEFSKE